MNFLLHQPFYRNFNVELLNNSPALNIHTNKLIFTQTYIFAKLFSFFFSRHNYKRKTVFHPESYLHCNFCPINFYFCFCLKTTTQKWLTRIWMWIKVVLSINNFASRFSRTNYAAITPFLRSNAFSMDISVT